MSKLTEDQKSQIRAEVDSYIAASRHEVVAQNKKVLSDLTVYKWIFRSLFATILGGSIAGVLLIPGWIDKLIADRMRAIDDLTFAYTNLQAGDYRAAYDSISNFITEMGTKSDQTWDLSKLTDPQKNYFFSTLLQVLVYNSNYDPTNLSEFRGKDRWRLLLKDSEFQKALSPNDQGFSANPTTNLNMALAYLRYGDTDQDLEQAYQYLHYYNSLPRSPAVVSPFSYSVFQVEGLLLLLLGRRDEAIRTASEDTSFIQTYNPYALTYSTASAQQLIGDYNDAIFKRLWKKFKKDNYDSNVCSLIRSTFISSVSAQVPALNGSKERSEFLKAALKTYEVVQDAIHRKDYAAINEMLEFRPPPAQLERFLSGKALLEKEHMSASIYNVSTTPNQPMIVVRFFPAYSQADLDANDSCSGVDPRSHKEEFWSFHKRDPLDQDWKLYFFSPPFQ